MKTTRLFVLMLSLSLIAGSGEAQTPAEVPLEIARWAPLPNSTLDFINNGALVRTTMPQGGGAEQCVNIGGTVEGFGATLMLPSVTLGGKANVGVAELAAQPYSGPDCTGEAGGIVGATPPIISGSTPYNSPVQVAVNRPFGTTKVTSIRVALIQAGRSSDAFEMMILGGFYSVSGDPDLTVSLTYETAFTENAIERLKNREQIRVGEFIVVVAKVTNVGTVATRGSWQVLVPTPARFEALEEDDAECCDMLVKLQGAVLAYESRRVLLPGESVIVLGLLEATDTTVATPLEAHVSGGGEKNVANNDAVSESVVVWPKKQAQYQFQGPITMFTSGRSRI